MLVSIPRLDVFEDVTSKQRWIVSREQNLRHGSHEQTCVLRDRISALQLVAWSNEEAIRALELDTRT